MAHLEFGKNPTLRVSEPNPHKEEKLAVIAATRSQPLSLLLTSP